MKEIQIRLQKLQGSGYGSKNQTDPDTTKNQDRDPGTGSNHDRDLDTDSNHDRDPDTVSNTSIYLFWLTFKHIKQIDI